MKKSIIYLCMLMLPFAAWAQVDLADIQVPDAPGFVLADNAPSSIDKPTTPRAFGISIYSLLQGGALQATPFWFFQQPKYNHDKFLENKTPLIETFNVSIATFKKDSLTTVSMGFKTHLLRLYSKENKAEVRKYVKDAATAIADLDLPADEEKGNAIMRTHADRIAAALAKPVLRVELAGAYLGRTPNNSFKTLAASKAGAWINASYSPYKSNLIVTALGRYSWVVGEEAKIGSDSSFLDYGLSVTYQQKKFDAALELVNRVDFSQKENYNRVAFVINYQLIDEITLVASLGRNFTDVNNIFSVFGAKFGLSGKRKKL